MANFMKILETSATILGIIGIFLALVGITILLIQIVQS